MCADDPIRKRISVYLSDQEHRELKSLCARLGYSMSNFVDIAIRDKIKKILKKENK